MIRTLLFTGMTWCEKRPRLMLTFAAICFAITSSLTEMS